MYNNNIFFSVRLVFIAVVFQLILCYCANNKTENFSQNQEPALSSINVPEFNADSAYLWVQKQVEFGPRVPNTVGHQKCGEWIIAQLKRWGAQVTVQKATVKDLQGKNIDITNIIASYNLASPKRIMLSAHWDTRPYADADTVRKNEPFLGANDGASGVAVLLELARIFQHNPPPVGIELCFWDAEDGGKVGDNESWCLGSQYWAKNKHIPNYTAQYGINLDMVGAKGATFLQEMVSLRYAPTIVEKIWSTAHQIGYGGFFPIYRHEGEIIDDHYFINTIAQIPYVDIIHLSMKNGSFFPHWHTHRDNLEVIDIRTLKAVGQTVLTVIFSEKSVVS
ncbi:MAG: M28 family peptidase [Bacteroidia bacterium]|nr:M28 family peptidase [Bacteroidia bacterium]MDW8158322.1 M28 family peptidase [Bacteroidia bacterium]